MIIETYTLPAHWASALINDDTSGMDYRDEKPFHDFCRFMIREHGNSWPLEEWTCTDEAQFMTYHDARRFGVLACDVLDYTFDVTPRGLTQ